MPVKHCPIEIPILQGLPRDEHAEEASNALSEAPGCLVDLDNPETFTTPIDCAGNDHTYISRIRNDNSIKNGLNLWVVSDNLRKGAALNTIQIAEILEKDYLG